MTNNEEVNKDTNEENKILEELEKSQATTNTEDVSIEENITEEVNTQDNNIKDENIEGSSVKEEEIDNSNTDEESSENTIAQNNKFIAILKENYKRALHVINRFTHTK